MDSIVTIEQTPVAERPGLLIRGVPSDIAREIWPHVEPFIKTVLEYAGGAFSPEHVLEDIETCKSQLWVAIVDGQFVGCVVSRILHHPNLSEVSCPIVGGTGLETWGAPMFAEIKKLARHAGCVRIDGVGRRGWARFLPDMKEVGSLMRMVL